MDYTSKLLKVLYEAIELLKDIKDQNDAIARRLKKMEELYAVTHGYIFPNNFNGDDDE